MSFASLISYISTRPSQKVPKDGLKKLMIQMEKQKLVYEEAAIATLQRAMQDKAEADSRAATLEVVARISQKYVFFSLCWATFDQRVRLCPPGDPDRYRGRGREVAEPLRGAGAEIRAAQEEPESQSGSTTAVAEPSGGAPLSQRRLRLTVSDLQIFIYCNICVLCSCPEVERRG